MPREPPVVSALAAFDLGRLVDLFHPAARFATVPVRRADDLLVLDLRFVNLRAVPGDGEARLERTDANARATLIAELPPQSFGEEAYLQVDLGSRQPDPPVKSAGQKEPVRPLPAVRMRMAGPSRLAFAMPPGVLSLPYTYAGVLEAMRTWPPQLAAGALPDPDAPRRGALADALTSETVVAAVAQLAAGLEAAGAEGVTDAIQAAAQRVAARAAGGLAVGTGQAVAAAALAALQPELDELHRRFPALREGAEHDAGIAALALASAEALAPVAGRFEIGDDALAELPYLPLLLAPHEPPATSTALELPYRLLLSPIEQARWEHRDAPVTAGGRTELWHTRLRTADGSTGRDGDAKVRALWSPDYPLDAELYSSPATPRPFRMSLHARDRQRLVRLMSGYDERRHGRRYVPRASRARRLHLSALGALLDVEGHWDLRPDDVPLEAWRHLAALGRDAYVRVVYVGYLVPFRHRAALIKVTERKFETLPGSGRIAVLRQRQFIVVRTPVVEYRPADHVDEGRTFPFTRAELLTHVTPDLLTPGAGASALVAAPGDTIYTGPDTTVAFWPMVPAGGAAVDVPFQIRVTDICGHELTFSLPLLFVDEAVNANRHAQVRRAYDLAATTRRAASLGGATVCYAPTGPDDEGDAALPTQSMTFAAGDPSAPAADTPNFYPETASSDVGILAVQKLLGRPEISSVTYPQVYREHGFLAANNPGGLFLRMLKKPRDLTFGGGGAAKSDQLGALAAPSMAILGLSKVMGPVAAKPPAAPGQIEDALKEIVANRFNPADFFRGATLLGGVPLAAVLKGAHDLAGADVPKLLTREFPDRVEASFDWSTTIAETDPLNLLVPNADGASGTPLRMRGVVTTPLGDPGAATYAANAELANFKLNLFGFIILWFDDLRFASRKGTKPDVTVGMHPSQSVRFGGPLEFVNELREYIPSNGFSDPPGLSVTPSGIAASYSLTLPSIQVGVFALKNLALGAGFALPFDATPASVRFNFCERQHPFSLTVSLLGGGGFFAIGISASGVQEIEASIEFGAEIAIDLGVASGGVEIKAGVYFHWLEKIPDQGTVELTGYVRLHGELSVLGLISASLTFNLQLGYIKEGGASKVFGEATLTIEVEVVFVSFDVSVTCRKEFAGPAADPKFIELVPDEPTWEEYCGAFAEEAAE